MNQSIVWSNVTRLLHWAVAVSIVLNLFVVEDGDAPHQWIGYFAVSIVVLRLLWGFVATDNTSFKRWPISISDLRTFAKSELMRKPIMYQGHNPAACYVYFVIWGLVIFLAVTGFMMGLDKYWGEEWLEDLHDLLSIGLQICVVAHFLGIALDSYQFKRKTWLGMITGTRPPLK